MSSSYVRIVEQAIELLESLTTEEYQSELKPNFPSSIGAHIRHIIDHFLAIQAGLSAGHIDYNKRHRHNQIEQFPQLAIEQLESIIRWISELTDEVRESKVQVTTEIDISHTKSASCESTIERELIFVTSHAIHHYALIRIICNLLDKQLPEFFGYAPATITHLNRSA